MNAVCCRAVGSVMGTPWPSNMQIWPLFWAALLYSRWFCGVFMAGRCFKAFGLGAAEA